MKLLLTHGGGSREDTKAIPQFAETRSWHIFGQDISALIGCGDESTADIPKTRLFTKEVTAQVDVPGHFLIDGRFGLLDCALVVDKHLDRVNARVSEVAQ